MELADVLPLMLFACLCLCVALAGFWVHRRWLVERAGPAEVARNYPGTVNGVPFPLPPGCLPGKNFIILPPGVKFSGPTPATTECRCACCERVRALLEEALDGAGDDANGRLNFVREMMDAPKKKANPKASVELRRTLR